MVLTRFDNSLDLLYIFPNHFPKTIIQDFEIKKIKNPLLNQKKMEALYCRVLLDIIKSSSSLQQPVVCH